MSDMAMISPAMVVAMMVAMMLPSIAPTVWRQYHGLATEDARRAGRATTCFVLGYASVWVIVGVALFALSSVLSPITPCVAGTVILGAGALQRTRWKAKQLAHCRDYLTHAHASLRGLANAWRAGWCLGAHCVLSCAAATAALFVVGLMDIRAMAVITLAITAERVAPGGARIARLTGALAIGVGFSMLR